MKKIDKTTQSASLNCPHKEPQEMDLGVWAGEITHRS